MSDASIVALIKDMTAKLSAVADEFSMRADQVHTDHPATPLNGATAAPVREPITVCRRLLEERRLRRRHPAVAGEVGEEQHVGGESIAAEVAALPGRPGPSPRERRGDGSTLDRAAGVVHAVGAHEQERVGPRLATIVASAARL